MKKLLMVLVIAGLLSSAAFAVDLTVNANVKKILTLGVDTASVTLEIDNDGQEVEALDAIDLTLISNQKAWTITFTSTNSGVLTSAGSADSIPYFVLVDTSALSAGVATNNLSSYTQLTSAKTIVSVITGQGGKTPMAGSVFPIDFKVNSYTAFYQTTGTGAGDTAYADTIQIAVAAN